MRKISSFLVVTLLLVTATANAAQTVTQPGKSYPDGHSGSVYFPMGDISFADEVVSFEPGKPKPAPRYVDKNNSLSIPNNASLSLGCRGTLVVKFTDNVLIDIDGLDLYIFELGGAFEPSHLELSEDGNTWLDMGKISGARAAVDLAGKVPAGASYRYVRITDLGTACYGDSPGADIDAIGAIGSALSVTLSGAVLFDTGKFNLKPEAKQVLDDFAAKLAGLDIKGLVVEGHTDNVGARQDNQLLSENRALSVKEYLTGLPAMRGIKIVARGYGEDRPLNDNRTAGKRQLNRRVQLIASPSGDVGAGIERRIQAAPANNTLEQSANAALAATRTRPASLREHLQLEDQVLDSLRPYEGQLGGFATVSAIARIKGAAQWANVHIKESLASFASSCQAGRADIMAMLPVIDAQRALVESVPVNYKSIEGALVQMQRLQALGLTSHLSAYQSQVPTRDAHFENLASYYEAMQNWHTSAGKRDKYFPVSPANSKAFASYVIGLGGKGIAEKQVQKLSFTIGFMSDVSVISMFDLATQALKLAADAAGNNCSLDDAARADLLKKIDNVALRGFWIPRGNKTLYRDMVTGLKGKDAIVDFLLPIK